MHEELCGRRLLLSDRRHHFGFIVVVFGITIAFLLIAGILNTIGGAYCIKAKSAIAAMQANGPPVAAAATAVAVPAAAVAVPAQAVPIKV